MFLCRNVEGEECNVFLWCISQEAFRAFHNDLDFVKKHLHAIHLGNLREDEATSSNDEEIRRDFEELRQTATKMVITWYNYGLSHELNDLCLVISSCILDKKRPF